MILLLLAGTARAQEVDESARGKARDLGYSGVEAYQKGDYQRANARLEEAYRLLPAPTLALWSARSLAQLGKLREAAERYRAATLLPVSSGSEAVQRQARAEAAQELEALLPRVPRVRFRAAGAPADEVRLSIDGEAVPSTQSLQREFSLNPGSHRVVAVSAGRQVERTFSLAERERREETLSFPPAPSTANSTTKEAASPSDSPGTRETLAWIGIGVGGAGVALGAVSGLWAMGKRSELKDSGSCENDHCAPEERGSVSTYNTLRHLSTAAFVVGGVSAATGVALLFTSKRSQPRASSRGVAEFAIAVTGSGAELRGRF